MIPLYHIFGSEELGIRAPAVAELVPTPYLGLNPEDAVSLQVTDGEEIEVSLNTRVYRLPVKTINSLPPRVAGLPVGLPALQGITLPAWGRVLVKKEVKEKMP